MYFAALDIGTVTCRLLLANVEPQGLVEHERRCEITNLGVGVDKTGLLREDAIQRVVSQIAEYVSVVNAYRSSTGEEVPIIALATSASRDAKNSQVLVDRLAELGVDLSVIPGSREAELSFKGASCAFADEGLMVVDIGGGSTEIIVGYGGAAPVFSHSFNIGCRRVTERFLHSDPPTQAELDDACMWVRESMKPVFERALAAGVPVNRIVAVAGTATTVVSVEKALEVYDSSKVDGEVVPRAILERQYDMLRSLPLAKRKSVVGLEPARASVIVAGLAILLAVLDLASCEEFTVSESDILQGIIMDAASH